MKKLKKLFKFKVIGEKKSYTIENKIKIKMKNRIKFNVNGT
jgi:hypothetical protein